ncbi:MAG: hypothetical protein QM820_45860 [Minicystis sp.]
MITPDKTLSRRACTVVIALLCSLSAACGGGGSGTGGAGGNGGGSGGSTAPATGCANFDNWDCIVSGYMCFATCDEDQIACDGIKCARTVGSSVLECTDAPPKMLPDCGDCRAAFGVDCH